MHVYAFTKRLINILSLSLHIYINLKTDYTVKEKMNHVKTTAKDVLVLKFFTELSVLADSLLRVKETCLAVGGA